MLWLFIMGTDMPDQMPYILCDVLAGFKPHVMNVLNAYLVQIVDEQPAFFGTETDIDHGFDIDVARKAIESWCDFMEFWFGTYFGALTWGAPELRGDAGATKGEGSGPG